MAVLSRLQQAGLTLGPEKCDINKPSVKFLGQLIDHTGVRPDLEKVQAILGMEQWSSIFKSGTADKRKQE